MQSMTGFGRAEIFLNGYQYSVEMKSVNHRYLDLRFRLPSSLASLESSLSEVVRAKIQRGSIDVSIRQKLSAENAGGAGTTRFVVDEKAAQSLREACEYLHREFKTPAIPTQELIASVGKVLVAVEEVPETSELASPLKLLVAQALDSLCAERTREGRETQKTLAELVQTLKGLASQWKVLSAGHSDKIRERLKKRLEQWALTGIDAQRLEMEIAFFADRADIAEEIQRFEAHLEEFSKLLSSPQPLGRKLDFLTQELHRETNTVASKADDLGIARAAVEAKTAIEKLREQVQNVE